jgi:ankyrin repeat protein
VDIRNHAGSDALDLASANRDASSLASLLKAMPDAGRRSQVLGDCLISSISSAQSETIAKLLEMGADLHFADAHGVTVLMAAARSGDQALFESMLAKGLRPDAHDAEGASALMYAVRGGNLAIYRHLLALGGAVGETTRSGENLLMAAAIGNHSEVAADLIARKLDVNAINNQGQTALMLVSANRDWDRLDAQRALIERLLKAGADPGLRDHQGRTVLHYASNDLEHSVSTFCLDDSPISRLLLAKPLKIDINAQDSRGRTALMNLVLVQGSDLTETLLQHGADPNLQDHDGNYALLGMFTRMCPPDQPGKYSASPFSTQEHDEVVRKVALLLAKGAKPDLHNKAGQSAKALGPEFFKK